MGKFVDNRTGFQQSLFGAILVFVAECSGNFRQGKRSSFTQFIESDVNLVGSTHEAHHVLFRLFAEATGILSEFVELLAAGAGVHPLEFLIQVSDLFLCHTGVFANIRHFLIHLGESVHRLTCGHGDARNGSHHNLNGSAPVEHLLGEAFPQRSVFLGLRSNFSKFIFDGSNFLHLLVPCFRAALNARQLLVELSQCLAQFFGGGFVEAR